MAALKPGRPKSAYLFFAVEMRRLLTEKEPNLGFLERGQKIGQIWHEMSDSEKEKYQEMASRDKERYNKEIASWKSKDDDDDPEWMKIPHGVRKKSIYLFIRRTMDKDDFELLAEEGEELGDIDKWDKWLEFQKFVSMTLEEETLINLEGLLKIDSAGRLRVLHKGAGFSDHADGIYFDSNKNIVIGLPR